MDTKLASPLLCPSANINNTSRKREGIMKKLMKVAVVAVMLAGLTVGQSTLMAAPVRGAAMASERSAVSSLLVRFLNILTAAWGSGGGASDRTAAWGSGNGGH